MAKPSRLNDDLSPRPHRFMTQTSFYRTELRQEEDTSQCSFSERLETAPVATRARSISVYTRHFEEPSHQKLIDSAVNTIQKEKQFIGAACALGQSTTQRSKSKMLASPTASSRRHKKGSKSARLMMFTPRVSARRKNGDFEGGKSSMSYKSEISKPDSPIKDSP